MFPELVFSLSAEKGFSCSDLELLTYDLGLGRVKLNHCLIWVIISLESYCLVCAHTSNLLIYMAANWLSVIDCWHWAHDNMVVLRVCRTWHTYRIFRWRCRQLRRQVPATSVWVQEDRRCLEERGWW